MSKGNTNAIRIANLHLATARLPSHIHQSKSTVQGLVSFFTGYPPGKGSYLNIVLPTEDFLSFPTCSPLEIGRASCRERASMWVGRRARDGIRVGHVTGVQTCALPI